MESALIIGLLAFFGLMFGSFAGAQVWRLRARQLRDEDDWLTHLKKKQQLSPDEREEEAYLLEGAKDRKRERTRLDGLLKSVKDDHSRCLSCQHRLAWYDLMPLLSWLSTGGRCRYCKARIGRFEPLMELGVAGAFVVSYLLWPVTLVGSVNILLFLGWIASIVLLAILFAYDFKWFLLPDIIIFPLIGVGIVISTVRVLVATDVFTVLGNVAGAVLVLSGLYGLLWFASRGRWIGFGDVKLGFGLALLLGDWRLSLLALFAANCIGSLVVIPSMLFGKLDRKAHVPFGPLLILGAFIAMLLGERLFDYYLALSSSFSL
jgi:prepilin signal peptidase PulO-like enzyme (type II secretory pathway)